MTDGVDPGRGGVVFELLDDDMGGLPVAGQRLGHRLP